MRIVTMLLFAVVGLGGCALHPRLAVATQPDIPTDWHMRLTANDRTAIDHFDATWHRARAAVPRRLRAAFVAEGPLVDPAVALPKPDLPPGLYYCRLIRFGGRAGFATAKPDFCTVVANADGVAFNKQSGASQPRGWLFGHNDTRSVFLGAFLGPHGAVSAYGENPELSVAGVVERVSAFRWRMAMTRAGGGGVLDIYELVPVTPKVPGSVPAVAG